LTFPPLKVHAPDISPDGSRVAFHDEDGNVSVISMNGGQTQTIEKGGWPSWSPDGNSLLFLHDDTAGLLSIADLRTGKVSVVPGTKDKAGSWWVSQDTLLSASFEGGNVKNLMIFDFKTQEWTALYTGSLARWALSLDRKYVYIATGGADPEVLRVRFADRQVEKITNLREIHRVDSNESNIDVAPDGSAVFTRDTGYQEIYALNVRWP
jgi:Tol biopolymer transport system component